MIPSKYFNTIRIEFWWLVCKFSNPHTLSTPHYQTYLKHLIPADNHGLDVFLTRRVKETETRGRDIACHPLPPHFLVSHVSKQYKRPGQGECIPHKQESTAITHDCGTRVSLQGVWVWSVWRITGAAKTILFCNMRCIYKSRNIK